MSYLTFHLIFIFPPILLLGWALLRTDPGARTALLGSRWPWAIAAVAGIAFVYTTPWDNYLVYREIWWYGPDRVLGTIGYVPVEEYLFFLLQPVLTGLWCYHLLLRRRGAAEWGLGEVPGLRMESLPTRAGLVRVLTALPWFLLTGLGVWLLTFDEGLYMGLILAWASPVVGLMWLYMGPRLWRFIHVIGLAVAVPTLYLWFADIVAMGQGIWEISHSYTLGPRPLSLPIEEATFFLITNVLVVTGSLLFLIPGMARLDPTEGQALDPSASPTVPSSHGRVRE
jgi:lycopene beta-cyclase